MRDDTLFRGAFGCRHIPSLGGCGDQHLPRGGTGLADVLLRVADPAAAAGGHRPPDPPAPHVLVHIGVLRAHVVPVALEFLGDQHRQAGERALTQLRAGHPHDHGFVRLNHQPVRDLGHLRRALRRLCRSREPNPQHQAAGEGGGLAEEVAAVILEQRCHVTSWLYGFRGDVDGFAHAHVGPAATDVAHGSVDLFVGRVTVLL
jgi:hypothetical protein